MGSAPSKRLSSGSMDANNFQITTPILESVTGVTRNEAACNSTSYYYTSSMESSRRLLDKATSTNFVSYRDSFSPLFRACHFGPMELLAALASDLPGVSAPDTFGHTALHIAAFDGNVEAADILIRAGANIDGGHHNITPLVVAAQNGHDEMVAFLLDHNADVKMVFDSNQLTAYDVAITAESKRMILAAQESRGLGLCSLCWEQPVNGACCFVPCGHNVVCRGCNARLIEKGIKSCPMCRTLIWCRMTASSCKIPRHCSATIRSSSEFTDSGSAIISTS